MNQETYLEVRSITDGVPGRQIKLYPCHDEAAFTTLKTYAIMTRDLVLSKELWAWIDRIEKMQEVATSIKPDQCEGVK